MAVMIAQPMYYTFFRDLAPTQMANPENVRSELAVEALLSLRHNDNMVGQKIKCLHLLILFFRAHHSLSS